MDNAIPPLTYPRGWFCLGPSSELRPGEARSVQAFGTRLAYFRGEDGRLRLIDGYCPHMGAELGRGCVVGEHLRCPFHHWSWDGDGRCVDIPYARRIPARALVASWPIEELNGLALFWYDPEGPSEPDYRIPAIADCGSSSWTPWELRSVQINTHWREIVDNVADRAHFGPVHHAPVSYFDNAFEGHRAVQHSRTVSDALGELDFVATYIGPAYQVGEYTATIDGRAIRARMLNTHLPLDENSFRQTFGVMLCKDDIDGDDVAGFLEQYVEKSLASFVQDVDIWMNKRYVENPVLCDGDGPLHQLRRWYAQFYRSRGLGLVGDLIAKTSR